MLLEAVVGLILLVPFNYLIIRMIRRMPLQGNWGPRSMRPTRKGYLIAGIAAMVIEGIGVVYIVLHRLGQG